jgi:hypothetical protein
MFGERSSCLTIQKPFSRVSPDLSGEITGFHRRIPNLFDPCIELVRWTTGLARPVAGFQRLSPDLSDPKPASRESSAASRGSHQTYPV